jgi:hypothetical protein
MYPLASALLIKATALAALSALLMAFSLPPPRYDHRTHGQVWYVIHTSGANLAAFCHRWDAEACTRRFHVTYLPRTGSRLLNGFRITRASYAVLYRHERAHVNGWRH